jgi:bifunctional DNA-binding transcriptional regulator/antitoxin component of YhaV-PrlF toxin-antitoxin module
VEAIHAESTLRTKNQLTVPDSIVKRLGFKVGDRFIFVVEDGDDTVVHLHRIQDSYAGALAGVFGDSPEDIAAYLEEEREAWEE